MSSIKVEGSEDVASTFVVRRSCSPEPQAGVTPVSIRKHEMPNRIRELHDQLDQLTADLASAKAKALSKKERWEAAEAKVDRTRRDIVSVVRDIDMVQTVQAGSDALPLRVSTAQPAQERGGIAESTQSHRGDDHEIEASDMHEFAEAPAGDSIRREAANALEAVDSRIDNGHSKESEKPSRKVAYAWRQMDIDEEDDDYRANSRIVVPSIEPHQDLSVQSASRNLTYRAGSSFLPLPYSHQPCTITSDPPTSIGAQNLMNFVEVLQKKQRASPAKLMCRKNVLQWAQQADANLLRQLRIDKGDDLFPLAQQYLNLVLEGQLKAYSVHFGDVNRPWLLKPRSEVPSIKKQLAELSQWERTMLPNLVPEVFYPLIDSLFSHAKKRSITISHLIGVLRGRGQDFAFMKKRLAQSSEGEWLHVQEFLEIAMTWCNLEIMRPGKSRGEDRIKCTNRQQPFKQKEHNDLYFMHSPFPTSQSKGKASQKDQDFVKDAALTLTSKRKAGGEEEDEDASGSKKKRG